MHPSSLSRMEWFVANYAAKLQQNKIQVLDVGSYDVNGSYRPLFLDSKFSYTGLDMEPGPNVDIVLQNPYNWSALKTDRYDVVISGQALEHMEFFWIIMDEMVRVLKKGGLLCIIAPNGFVEHRYPVDCYRFFTDSMVALARYCKLELHHAHNNCAPAGKETEWYSDICADCMLIAGKPYAGPAQHPDFRIYQCVAENHETLRNGFVPCREKRTFKWLCTRLWQRFSNFLSLNLFRPG